jgi:AraC-like DNA-binding protein
MHRHTHTILVRFPRLLLDEASALGMDREQLLAAAELSEADLENLDARLPVVRYWKLWSAVVERSEDPALGIRLGRQFTIRLAGLVGYAMLHSSTLGHALARFVRYERIMEDTTLLSLEKAEGSVHLSIEEPVPLAGLRQPIECDLASVVACLREITGVATLPAEVHLPYPQPKGVGLYREALGPKLSFESRRAVIVFEAGQLELPVTARDDTLCHYLDEHATVILQHLSSSTLVERVQRVLWDQLSEGRPTLQSVASALGMSVRTLQRRLKEEGVSFGELLDTFRERMAGMLLARRDLAIYEVAFLLGYSDPSTFFRAFRRWKGVSPRQFREAVA